MLCWFCEIVSNNTPDTYTAQHVQPYDVLQEGREESQHGNPGSEHVMIPRASGPARPGQARTHGRCFPRPGLSKATRVLQLTALPITVYSSHPGITKASSGAVRHSRAQSETINYTHEFLDDNYSISVLDKAPMQRLLCLYLFYFIVFK